MLQELPANERSIKRRVATIDECKLDLGLKLKQMFDAFNDALKMFEKEVVQTPPVSRARAFEASLLNSKMIQSIQTHFPTNWKFGRYRRFLLNIEGYTILFKKLNSKDKPMNVRTIHSSSIENQSQVSLFPGGHASIDPILFFGYKRNIIGKIFDPKLVYIDEHEVRWTITENSIETNEGGVVTINRPVTPLFPTTEKIHAKYKGKQRKASNDSE